MPATPLADDSPSGRWPFRRVCVFCGSSAGTDPAYREAAAALGRLLGEQGIGLVYGGGSAGLMGALADAALDAGADVVGILPAGLFPDGVTASPLREHHSGTFSLEETADMHARKARFHALGDAFVALPGGLGTLEELSEVATWAQIGIHDRAIGLLDVNGYFDALLAWFDRAVADGFLRRSAREQLHVEADPAALLDRLAAHRPVVEGKWIDP